MPEGETTIDALIGNLKKRTTPAPNIEDIKSELDPDKHKVMSTIERKKRRVTKERMGKDMNGRPTKEEYEDDEEVNRIALAIQDLIVERAVAFLFGNEPVMTGDIVTDGEKAITKLVEKIKLANKVDAINRQVARTVFSATEAAEFWFPVPAENYTKYGVPTQFKLRSKIYDPLKGYELFPRFDESGDFVVFSVQYKRTDGINDTTYFEVFTEQERAVFSRKGVSDWEVEKYGAHAIGKMPIIYCNQKEVEWKRVQNLIERLETLLSNFADAIDYHAWPKIFFEGVLKGFMKKGETGGILHGETGSKAQYLSWDHAPTSVKLEIETLLGQIYTLTQTPNISFENVKGLGGLSGIALKLMFLDAHLKVKNKEEIFNSYLQRRNSILIAYAGLLDTSLDAESKSLDLYDVIKPYMIEDIKEMVETLMAANGNQPIMPQKESVRISPYANNPEDDYKQIQEETKQRNSFDAFETTN